ncbi:hypothetical protein [Bacillus sp. FJAT-29814]|nr:hypothetical protein [Bacillus sp. FJAT-29814]
MNSNKNQPNHKQNKQENNKNVPAQKDGFRYDYNDSSDFKDNEKI